MVAYSVPLASKVMTATYVLMVTMATPAVSDKQYMCRRWLLGSTDYGAVLRRGVYDYLVDSYA